MCLRVRLCVCLCVSQDVNWTGQDLRVHTCERERERERISA